MISTRSRSFFIVFPLFSVSNEQYACMLRDFETPPVVTSRGMANTFMRIHCIQCE